MPMATCINDDADVFGQLGGLTFPAAVQRLQNIRKIIYYKGSQASANDS